MHLHPGDGEGGEELACKGRSTLSDLRHLRALGIRFSGRPWQNKGKMCRLLKGLAVGTAMCRLLKGLAVGTAMAPAVPPGKRRCLSKTTLGQRLSGTKTNT